MLWVGINGYGTIGKRVADAIRAQPDMRVAGVAKTHPDFEAEIAVKLGYPLYTIEDRTRAFAAAGFDLAGTVDALVEGSDVVVDATPAGVGAGNRDLYEAGDTPAVFQGGEDAAVGDVSFTARANYDAAVGARFVRVVSCNTTGLARLVAPLEEAFGIEKVRATLVRRGGDPAQADRGPINDALLDPVSIPSHHAADLDTVLPEVPIDTLGLRVPTTLMHTHAVNLTLEASPTPGTIRDRLEAERRIIVLPEDTAIDGAGKLKELALDAGRPRGDYWENCVWGESIAVRGRDCYLFQAIHQEADVVPENVDAVRALAGTADREESMARTDEHLGIGLSVAGPRRRAAPGR